MEIPIVETACIEIHYYRRGSAWN